MRKLLIVLLSLAFGSVSAGEVEIRDVLFIKKAKSWTVRVMLLHKDTGWDHYADAWRIVDEKGNELAKRILQHPHENEQPFTRSLSNIVIPRNVGIVFVEAHDNVHAWSRQRVRIDLSRKDGPGYHIK